MKRPKLFEESKIRYHVYDVAASIKHDPDDLHIIVVSASKSEAAQAVPFRALSVKVKRLCAVNYLVL